MTKFKKYLEEAAWELEDGRCGAGAVELPKWFPLTCSCHRHDTMYLRIRWMALQAYQNYTSEERVSQKLDDIYWRGLIERSDEKFKKYMRGQIEKEPLPKRILLYPLEAAFFAIVKRAGFAVWKKGVLREWRRLRSM